MRVPIQKYCLPILSALTLMTAFAPHAANAQPQGAGADQTTNVDDHDPPMRLRRPGSPQEDITLDRSPTNNMRAGEPFQLGVERRHALPETEMPPLPGRASESPLPAPQLRSEAAMQDKEPFLLNAEQRGLFAATQSAPLRGEVTVKLLADYDIELIVDQSLSMMKRDCPGFLSRWQWCGMQSRELANQLSRYAPGGLTITTFARNYRVYRGASPGDLADLFDNPTFSGGTRLSLPLRDRLQGYFNNRKPGSKPMLIAVITDGVPHPFTEPDLVADTLIAATQRMHDPREVTVVFFQIGGADRFGRFFLNAMDNDLVRNGARFDCVHTVGFEQLVRFGLAQCLVDSIKDFAAQQQGRTIGDNSR